MITAPIRTTGYVLFGSVYQCSDDLLPVPAVESPSAEVEKAPGVQPYLRPSTKVLALQVDTSHQNRLGFCD
jgi:hypothetical protein